MQPVDTVLTPNKYPGSCHYCGRRVQRGVGTVWQREPRVWTTAHLECVTAAIADGCGPVACSSAETRAAMGLGPARDTRGPGALLKAAREVLKTVRLDSPDDDVEGAVNQLRALFGAPSQEVSHVPF